MRVLVLNCGSSSVKFAVIDTQTKQSIASGLVENIGVNGHTKAKGPAPFGTTTEKPIWVGVAIVQALSSSIECRPTDANC